jgi:predicted secreted protein
MASAAKAGPGFLLDVFWEDAWAHIGEVQGITGPSETTDTEEVTNQDSEGGYKEYLATLQDGGDVTFPMNLVPDDPGQILLTTIKHARATVPWRIQLVDTGFWAHFEGLITALGRTFPMGVMKRNVTIKVSGPVDELESEEPA